MLKLKRKKKNSLIESFNNMIKLNNVTTYIQPRLLYVYNKYTAFSLVEENDKFLNGVSIYIKEDNYYISWVYKNKRTMEYERYVKETLITVFEYKDLLNMWIKFNKLFENTDYVKINDEQFINEKIKYFSKLK